MRNFKNLFFIDSSATNFDIEKCIKTNHTQYQCYLAKCENREERRELNKVYEYFKKTISLIDTIETMIDDYHNDYAKASRYIKKHKFTHSSIINTLEEVLNLIYNRPNTLVLTLLSKQSNNIYHEQNIIDAANFIKNEFLKEELINQLYITSENVYKNAVKYSDEIEIIDGEEYMYRYHPLSCNGSSPARISILHNEMLDTITNLNNFNTAYYINFSMLFRYR